VTGRSRALIAIKPGSFCYVRDAISKAERDNVEVCNVLDTNRIILLPRLRPFTLLRVSGTPARTLYRAGPASAARGVMIAATPSTIPADANKGS